MNLAQLGLSSPNSPAQWPYTFLEIKRRGGVGDLVSLLSPAEWIQSQKSHLQEPFFSKGICGHRRKGSIKEQPSPCHSVSSTRQGKHWESQRLVLPGPTESAFTFIRIQSDVDLYKLNAAKEITNFRVKASAALCKHNCWENKGQEG